MISYIVNRYVIQPLMLLPMLVVILVLLAAALYLAIAAELLAMLARCFRKAKK